MFNFFKKKKKTDKNNMADQIALGANAENLSRHSEAAREYVKAYSGYDAATGQTLQKSLSGIAGGKPNLAGQRGYAAEVKDVAKRNAEEILKGSDIRYARVDDLPGHAVNETPFDIMAVNRNGEEIISLGSQMKFNQGNPSDVVDTLLGKKFREKYPHAQYSVPKDRYNSIKQAMGDKRVSLEKQLKTARQNGNSELASNLQERLEYVKKAEKQLVPSKLSLNEAELAVKNPFGETTKEVLQLGHDAGVTYAKGGALIKGAITFAGCLKKVMCGEETPEEAVAEIAAESAKGAAIGYTTGYANTAIASVLKNSSEEVIKKLADSSAPAQIVIFVTSVFRIASDRMDGKITDEECFHGVAKSGVGIIGTFKAGTWGAKVGGAVGTIGGPVGAIVGSVVASVVIDATYDYAVVTLKAPGIAYQERIQIERECEQLHRQLEQYRTDFRNTYMANTDELVRIFGNSLRDMAMALKMNDADSFIVGANTITRSLGGTIQFNNVDEFEKFLDSDESFNL